MMRPAILMMLAGRVRGAELYGRQTGGANVREKRKYWAVAAALAVTFGGCQTKPPEAVEAAGERASVIQKILPRTSYELPAGTVFAVRLDHQVDTARNRAGDAVTATKNRSRSKAEEGRRS